MRTVKPIGETQIGPVKEIRFKGDPVTVPGEKVIVELAACYAVVVEATGVGENGYTKGKILSVAP